MCGVAIFVATARRAYQDHNLYGYCRTGPKAKPTNESERGENNSSDKQAMKSNKLRVQATTTTTAETSTATIPVAITATIATTNCVCHINYLLLNWQLFVVIYCVINCVYESMCVCVCVHIQVCVCVNAGLCVFYLI